MYAAKNLSKILQTIIEKRVMQFGADKKKNKFMMNVNQNYINQF